MQKSGLLSLIFFFFFTSYNQLAIGDQSTSIKREIELEKKELNSIKSKLVEEAKKINKEEKREKSLLEKLRIINKNLNAHRKEMQKYSNSLKITDEKITRIEAKIKKTKGKIQIQKNLLLKRLRAIYKEGEPAYLKVVFSATDPKNFLQRLKYMKILANYDAELIAHYKANIENLIAAKNELQKATKSTVLYKNFTQKKKNEIYEEKKKKIALLNKIRSRKSTHEKLHLELLEASKELTSLISILEKSYLEEKKVNFPKRKGFLPWPVKGQIISTFGKVKNKIFQTYTFHNGVVIASPIGKSVRAVHDGLVLFSGNLKGYGLIVIIGHGKEYYSLYAHLNRSFVKKGTKVKTGQILGHTGDSDSLNGPSLYFEIRNKRVPVDPLKWLSVAKK